MRLKIRNSTRKSSVQYRTMELREKSTYGNPSFSSEATKAMLGLLLFFLSVGSSEPKPSQQRTVFTIVSKNNGTYEITIQRHECPEKHFLHKLLPGEFFLRDGRDATEETQEMCLRCTQCDDGVEVKRECSQYNDVICGRKCLQPGYRFDEGTQSCQHEKVLDEGFTHEELRQWLAAQEEQARSTRASNVVSEVGSTRRAEIARTSGTAASAEAVATRASEAKVRSGMLVKATTDQKGDKNTSKISFLSSGKKSSSGETKGTIPVEADLEEGWGYQDLLLIASGTLFVFVFATYVYVAIKRFRPEWFRRRDWMRAPSVPVIRAEAGLPRARASESATATTMVRISPSDPSSVQTLVYHPISNSPTANSARVCKVHSMVHGEESDECTSLMLGGSDSEDSDSDSGSSGDDVEVEVGLNEEVGGAAIGGVARDSKEGGNIVEVSVHSPALNEDCIEVYISGDVTLCDVIEGQRQVIEAEGYASQEIQDGGCEEEEIEVNIGTDSGLKAAVIGVSVINERDQVKIGGNDVTGVERAGLASLDKFSVDDDSALGCHGDKEDNKIAQDETEKEDPEATQSVKTGPTEAIEMDQEIKRIDSGHELKIKDEGQKVNTVDDEIAGDRNMIDTVNKQIPTSGKSIEICDKQIKTEEEIDTDEDHAQQISGERKRIESFKGYERERNDHEKITQMGNEQAEIDREKWMVINSVPRSIAVNRRDIKVLIELLDACYHRRELDLVAEGDWPLVDLRAPTSHSTAALQIAPWVQSVVRKLNLSDMALAQVNFVYMNFSAGYLRNLPSPVSENLSQSNSEKSLRNAKFWAAVQQLLARIFRTLSLLGRQGKEKNYGDTTQEAQI